MCLVLKSVDGKVVSIGHGQTNYNIDNGDIWRKHLLRLKSVSVLAFHVLSR